MNNSKAAVAGDLLAVLAARVGLVANTDAGHSAYKAWLSTDEQAARKAVFSRVGPQHLAARPCLISRAARC